MGFYIKKSTQLRNSKMIHCQVGFVNNSFVTVVEINRLVNVAICDFPELLQYNDIKVELLSEDRPDQGIGVAFDVPSGTEIPKDYLRIEKNG